MTPEAECKKLIKKLFAKYNIYYFMKGQMGFGRVGIADFTACVAGFYLAVEAKSNKGDTTRIQDIEIEKVIKSGGVAFAVKTDQVPLLEKIIVAMLKKAAEFEVFIRSQHEAVSTTERNINDNHVEAHEQAPTQENKAVHEDKRISAGPDEARMGTPGGLK